jgi:hypothetical protein
MDVENLAKELILKNMTPEQQMAVLDSVRQSVLQAKEVQKKKIGENVDLVVQALKKIESDITTRFESVGNSIEKRVLSIKDGRDGADGKDGRDGKDGKSGKDGLKGERGLDGQAGRDGVDGVDGISVVNANIDFDGSLVISLSDGREINVGEVVSADVAEKIKVISTMSTNAAIAIKDEGTSITSSVKNINFVGATVTATNSGDDVTVNVSAGTGTVTSVAATVPAFLSVTGSPITTSGTLAIGLSGTALPVVNGGTGVTTSTGTGNAVLSISPTLTTPALGTPSALVGTNITGTATNFTASNVTTNANLTGDVTSVGNASTLATVNTNVGSFTNASLTVNGKGLVTAVSSGTAPVTSVTGTSPVASSGGATPAISLAANYGDTQNPYASKTSNFVLAAPNGSAGAPTFRAIVAADIPTLNQNTTGSAATLTTPRAIYGNNFDGSAALTQVIASTYGGTGNGFTKFTGATTAERTYTLPDASSTIVVQGGALGTPSSGIVTNLTGTASININGTVGATTASSGAFTTLSATGVTTVQAGTAALPAITTTGDTNTGIFFPAADTIAFTEGGAEAMRITSAGDVGIGTSSPSTKLHVEQSTTGDAFKVARGGNYLIMGGSGSGTQYVKGYEGVVAFGNAFAGTTTFLTGDTERMRIDSSGKVGVNTGGAAYGGTVFRLGVNDTNYCIAVNATAGGTTDMIDFYSSGTFAGKVSSNGATTAYNTSSDYRLKEDIAPLTGALTKVSALKPVTFKWKLDGNSGEGFIAHELAEVCPYAVNGEKDEVDSEGNIRAQSIDTSFLVATLTAAIQEQQALITALTARIEALEAK